MKTALIVDDSRVARAVLRKTLVQYGIEVQEVPSAESAITYLKTDRPDIIFLDHQMPGMDGFDALGVLKANPATATIPVMMYTSLEGQFYVSQARALGAVDVLPKSLAPADVERVLRSHHLIGEPDRMPAATAETEKFDPRDLLEPIQTIVDEQTAMLRAEFRREMDRVHATYSAQMDQMLDDARAKPPKPPYPRLAAAASVATLAIVVAAGVPFMGTNRATDEADVQPPVAGTIARMPTAARVEPAATGAPAPSAPAEIGDTDARSWNYTHHYDHDAIPLDDDRARAFLPLFSELKSNGFAGTVTLEVHEGSYCINYTAEGAMQLAPADQPAASCDYIGTPKGGVDRSLQSLMFANMVASTTRDGSLRIDTVSHGTSEPLVEYPSLDDSVTAGRWNSIADINQRITMRVHSDDGVYRSEQLAHLQQWGQ